MSKLIMVLGTFGLLALTGWFVRSRDTAPAKGPPVQRLMLDEAGAREREPATNVATRVVVLPVAVASAVAVGKDASPSTETEKDWKSQVPVPELERWEQDRAVEFLAGEFARGATSTSSVVTERAMRAALQTVPGMAVESVRCVAAMCKLVLLNQDADQMQLLTAMTAHEVLQGEKIFSHSEDGTRVTVFAAPPGAPLPRPAAELD